MEEIKIVDYGVDAKRLLIDESGASIQNLTYSSSMFNDIVKNDPYYSDKYFKHNQTLPSRIIDLKKFVQTERNLLVSNDNFYSTNFVPFYLRAQRNHSISYNNEHFSNYVPIFDYLLSNTIEKSFDNYITRISLGCKKKKRNIRNLDEIQLIGEEFCRNAETDSIQEADNLIETRYERNELLLDPLSLELNQRRAQQFKISQSEHKKIVRITIVYVLAFFALALVTFFSLYLL